MSSSKNIQAALGSVPEFKATPTGGRDTPDIGKGWKTPTPSEVQGLFAKVKQQAEKAKATARKGLPPEKTKTKQTQDQADTKSLESTNSSPKKGDLDQSSPTKEDVI